MAPGEPSFTLGIEEEYLLVDRATRDLVSEPPPEFFQRCESRLGERVTAEFLRSQIEVRTGVCRTMAEVATQLTELRRAVGAIAAEFGMAPIAASTHPFAQWQRQRHTAKDRYELLARDLQGVARRLVIGGMHVHVAIEDVELRIDLMNQASYFLPHLLALSTSSPFWLGEATGLKSFRLSVFDSLPRTGLPERFESHGDYERLIGRLTGAGLIEDASKIWWDLRPSVRYPTLEMRITDVCTLLRDAVAIAALYRCLLSMLYRLRRQNQRWRIYPLLCLKENRWRAERYGTSSTLVDFGLGQQVSYPRLLEEILALVAPDAAAFGCKDEVAATRRIVVDGTSADRQLAVHARSLAAGAAPAEALRGVVDWLIEATQPPAGPP
ncbi:MAG: carboxylate-amine ligase [Alphaproteobacteria bacterium]|nr:carboxylate-amine ligase [Alphaproteobacteria bacterium]